MGIYGRHHVWIFPNIFRQQAIKRDIHLYFVRIEIILLWHAFNMTDRVPYVCEGSYSSCTSNGEIKTSYYCASDHLVSTLYVTAYIQHTWPLPSTRCTVWKRCFCFLPLSSGLGGSCFHVLTLAEWYTQVMKSGSWRKQLIYTVS